MLRLFAYCRKSTEEDNRQILSIPSQTAEMKKLGQKAGGHIIEVLSESRSAKEPGRPVFNDMMRRIEAGEADGIVCWKLDRLARNPIDGGAIIWAVNQRDIKIITPTQTYQKGDESVILMWLEFGVAHKFVIDLGRNVKRGLEEKAGMGWKPGYANLGYKNHRLESDLSIIIDDPERFPIARRMWELLLTNRYSVEEILDTATNEWGLLSRSSRKKPAKPFSRAGIYRMFTNPFYHGEFEYPSGSGCWYHGAHTPMVTRAEFERAQQILGRTDRPRRQRHNFTFVGMMKCGECGASITAEEKWKWQKNGNRHFYIYYHCTKRIDRRCTQGSIEEKHLISQIESFLFTLEVPQFVVDWIIQYIDEVCLEEMKHEVAETANVEKRLNKIDQSLRELTKMRYQRLIADDEFERERTALNLDRARLTAAQKAVDSWDWKEATKFIYATLGSVHRRFIDSAPEGKKSILAEVGSNLIVKDKKLIFEAKEPFVIIQKAYFELLSEIGGFEPLKNGSVSPYNPFFEHQFISLRGTVTDVRTCLEKERKKKAAKKGADQVDNSLNPANSNEDDKAA